MKSDKLQLIKSVYVTIGALRQAGPCWPRLIKYNKILCRHGHSLRRSRVFILSDHTAGP